MRAFGGAQILVDGSTISQNYSGNSGGGIFAGLYGSSSLTLEKSTISANTAAAYDNVGDYYSPQGGCVYALSEDGTGSLAVNESVISGNSASSGSGGGMLAQVAQNYTDPFPTTPSITISGSLFSDNTAYARGGGLFTYNHDGTEAVVEDTRVTGNQVLSGNGGGIYAYVWDDSHVGTNTPKFTITRSTVDNNDTYSNGGGIFVCAKYNGYFVATNSTFSDNSTTDTTYGSGGGMYLAHYPSGTESIDAYVRNVTVTQNVSPHGGGIATIDYDNTRVRLDNTIISQNFADQSKTTPNNLAGRFDIANTKYNLVGSGSTILNLSGTSATLDSTNFTNNDTPMLGPLDENGGATPTHALLAGSAAIDHGSDNLARDPLTGVALSTDQRGTGLPRIFDISSVSNGSAGSVDIGAYEIGLPTVIQVIVSGLNSTHAPYDFADAVGSGEQIRTVPVGGADTIQIRFSEAVTISAGDVTVQSADTSSFYSGSLTVSSDGRSATWRLTSGVFVADQIVLTVDDSVTGLAGALDGEWTNPTSLTATGTSVFPSGNGTAGGDFAFYFTILSGDFSHNNIVDSGDYTLWRKGDGIASGALHVQGDANGDGAVNQTDYNIWRSEFGTDFTLWPT